MYILGIHIGHDSSTAIIKDGQLLADVAEERFNRFKHYCGLPIHSIQYCLKTAKIGIEDVDAIAIPSQEPVQELNFLLDLKGAQRESPAGGGMMLGFVRRIMKRISAKPPLYIKNFPIRSTTRIYHVDHHLAHAASAYYTNPIPEKQLICTMDGAGDGASICIWRGENNQISLLKRFPTSASLGWFYSNVTEALGWWHGDGEGKTMGLAPYGDYSRVRGLLDRFFPKFNNGDVSEPHDFGQPYFWNENSAIQWHFDEANAIKKIIDEHGREHIAAEAQRILEEQTGCLIHPWLEKEKTRNLSCAGGIFLNVKLNQRIWESGKVVNHHIYPNAGDSGLAVGAALHVYYTNNPSAKINPLNTLYWGPEYSNDEIEKVLKLRNIQYSTIDNIEKYMAEQLANNKIIAWFQGRMESGPRALGNRSILMNANIAENKDIINARVKFREAFRPFCPSLIWEEKNTYLEKARDEFFMITSFTCQQEKRKKVPAVVHADSTLRPQTIKKEHNERFWRLIKNFGECTGEPLLLNTSFNIMGEPIISHPRDAIRCFYDNGLDFLVLGNFLLKKK